MGFKVLCVDDCQEIVDAFATYFKKTAHHFVGEIDPRNVKSLIADNSFDLVLLDVMMPEMDGSVVLSIIRESYNKLELPVIIVTANDGPQNVVSFLNHGANDYLTKPVDLGILRAKVENHLKMKEMYMQQKRCIDIVSGMSVAILDKNGFISSFNNSFMQIMKTGNRLGRDINFKDVFKVASVHKDVINNIINSKESLEIEVDFSPAPGKTSRCSVRLDPVMDISGNVVNVLVQFIGN